MPRCLLPCESSRASDRVLHTGERYYHDSDEDDEQDEADFDTEAELGRLGIDFSADGPG
jgi:hypothetical protein